MPNALTIKVLLPANRDSTGSLELIDPTTGLPLAGPFPVPGRAARNTAKIKGNPGAISIKPFGDTPLGGYNIGRIVGNGKGTTRPIEVYGAAGSIVMNPTSGDAATAKANGRTGLLIHAGRQPDSPTPIPSHLKTTNGCLRMLEGDLEGLIQQIKDNSFLFPGQVNIEIAPIGSDVGNLDEDVDDGDPPPLQGGGVILP